MRRLMRLYLAFALITAFGLFTYPSTAVADPIGLTVSAIAGASTSGSPTVTQQITANLSPNAIVVAPISVFNSYTDTDVSTLAMGSTSGTVNFGSITTSLFASGTESSMVFPPGINLNNTQGTASFLGIWQDTLAVTSSTLAKGSPVDLLFTEVANGELSCSGTYSTGQVSIGFNAGINSISIVDNTCNTTFSQTKTLDVRTQVGAILDLEGSLDANVGARGTNQVLYTAAVDPPSAGFFIDSETAGATYTTGSGTTYFSPSISSVPELPSFLLLGTGLFGLVRMKRPR